MCSRKSKIGKKVKTEFGDGVIVGIDLPKSRVWRWVVKITKPIKQHSSIEKGEPICFFDKEVTFLENQ